MLSHHDLLGLLYRHLVVYVRHRAFIGRLDDAAFHDETDVAQRIVLVVQEQPALFALQPELALDAVGPLQVDGLVLLRNHLVRVVEAVEDPRAVPFSQR